MFPVFDVRNAQFKVSQIDLMLEFSTADNEVAWLDVPMDHLVAMQELNAVNQLQPCHEGSLESEASAATLTQGLQIFPKFLNDNIGPAVLFKGLFDLGKAMEMRLFQSLISLDLVLHEFLLLLGIALQEEDCPILTQTLLDHLVTAILDHLYRLVLSFDHEISIYSHSMLATARIYLLMGRFASGKTTLIRKILSEETTEKYAIIQNEFAEGQMGIEQPLIMDETGTPFSSFLELPNGCICCSAKNDLIAAVEYIINNTQVRNIVVETNGLADPAASIKQFWFDEQMNINAQLHSVVTMVSARKWDEICKDETFLKQCVFANKIIVSFVDVMGQDKYREIEKQLTEINCECLIQRSDHADLQKILQGETLFDKEILANAKNKINTHHGHSNIRPNFIRGRCTLKEKIEVEQKVGELLWEKELKILRIKGVVCLESSPFVFELQGVEDLFEVKQTKTSVELYNKESRILVIGEELQSKIIEQVLSIKQ